MVRDILGHSTIGLTADTYAGVLPSLQREAVARLGEPDDRSPIPWGLTVVDTEGAR